MKRGSHGTQSFQFVKAVAAHHAITLTYTFNFANKIRRTYFSHDDDSGDGWGRENIPRNLFHCFVLGAADKHGLPGKEGPGIAVRATGQSIAWKRDEVRTQARDDPGNVASNTRTVHQPS